MKIFKNLTMITLFLIYLGLMGCTQSEQPAIHTGITVERHVALDGQSNFRDLGGYKTVDGRTVKWGQIYRSGELSGLSDTDIEKLDSLKIQKVVNFLLSEEMGIATWTRGSEWSFKSRTRKKGPRL